MEFNGIIRKFPCNSEWELNSGEPGHVVNLPIEIEKVETEEKIEFDYFIWDDKEAVICSTSPMKTQILYSVENRAGIKVVRFRVKMR